MVANDSLDMNESATPPEVNNGVPVETLVYIIGTHEVERFVYEQQTKKIQEQAVAIQQQNVMLKAELESLRKKQQDPLPVDRLEQINTLHAENERLVRVNASDDERIKQLEDTVHKVAIERDEMIKQRDNAFVCLDNEGLHSKESDEKIVELTKLNEALKAALDAVPTKKNKVKVKAK